MPTAPRRGGWGSAPRIADAPGALARALRDATATAAGAEARVVVAVHAALGALEANMKTINLLCLFAGFVEAQQCAMRCADLAPAGTHSRAARARGSQAVCCVHARFGISQLKSCVRSSVSCMCLGCRGVLDAAGEPVIITTPQGRVEGLRDPVTGVEAFKGIPVRLNSVSPSPSAEAEADPQLVCLGAHATGARVCVPRSVCGTTSQGAAVR